MQVLALGEYAATRLNKKVETITYLDLPKVQELLDYRLLDEEDVRRRFNRLIGIPHRIVCARYALIRVLSRLVLTSFTQTDLSEPNISSSNVAYVIRHAAKYLTHAKLKEQVWLNGLARTLNDNRGIQFVILNRAEARKPRATAESRLRHSLFYQAYSQLGLNVDTSTLRRHQSWMAKFVGEGGHDVGGLFSQSLVEMCEELQDQLPGGEPRLPLFRLCPNGHHGIGDNRGMYLPDPSATSVEHRRLYVFLGRLMGLSTLDAGRSVPVDFPPLVWKKIVGEPVSMSDLRAIDEHTFIFLRRVSDPRLKPSTFESRFPDLNFTITPSFGHLPPIELLPNGANIPVTFDRRYDYVRLATAARLNEFDYQIKALIEGIGQAVPLTPFTFFDAKQAEIMVAGVPHIDVEQLKMRTHYRGGVSASQPHIINFWKIMESFDQEERAEFLKFVWGRSRLPTSAPANPGLGGSNNETFQIADHEHAIRTGNPDKWLPIAHTCFFVLDLPRYTSIDTMRSKIVYAMRNCSTVDADATFESRNNLNMNQDENDSDVD